MRISKPVAFAVAALAWGATAASAPAHYLPHGSAAMVAQAGAGAAPTARKKKSTRRVLRVGPTRRLKAPSQAARLARDGDIIRIDAGAYRDCAVWRANNLTLQGVGGYAHVKDVSCERKAIWVIKGANTRIDRIEFSGADVIYNNGAGIRLEGNHLLVRNSYFHDNENGILAGRRPKSRVRIVASIFERNGKCEPDCAHGIYIGRVAKLTVIGSTFRDQRIGHHIKTRAAISEIIGNRILDGPLGTASFSIDIPNGGTAIIRGNFMEKGPRSDNRMAMISIGEEGVNIVSRGLLIEQNFFKNAHGRETFFVWNRSGQRVTMKGNRFIGKGTPLKGAGVVVP